MPSAAAAILQDIVEALRATGAFALVKLGEGGSDTAVPRASVAYEGQDAFVPDDCPSCRWVRLRAAVAVRTRSDLAAEGLARAADLSAAAVAGLLADPYRNGRCADLPIGRATEVGRCEVVSAVRRPEVEMSFTLRCHFETPEDGQ